MVRPKRCDCIGGHWPIFMAIRVTIGYTVAVRANRPLFQSIRSPMPISLEIFLAQSLLIFGFATPGISSYTGVYLALATMIYGFRYVFMGTERFWDVGAWRMLMAAVVLLLVPMPFHWNGPADLYPLLVIVPILLAPGTAALVRRYPNMLSLETMCWALLAGAVASAALVWYEAMVLGIVRPGGDNNPIHFGGIVTILGFGAMTGVFIVSGWWRFVFLLGPVMAAFAVILTGSRGPALAVLGLAVVAIGFLAWHWRKSRLIWALFAGVVVAGFLVWFLLHGTPEFERIAQSFLNAPAILADINTGLDVQRSALITGSIGAYLDAPILGHGFSHMMGSIVPHLSPDQIGVANYDHLHSDLADFSVLGGVFGLAALAALLLSPFVAARSYRGTIVFRGVLYLSIVVGFGTFLLGLTNAVIGLLPQTTLVGMFLGYLVGVSGQQR